MRPNNNPRRMRGRSGGGNKNKIPNRNQTFDSNGPEIRVRGNAHQIFEKYQAMAREATTAGDRITAESYFQHAEHYFRMIAASGGFHRPQEPWGENEGDDQGQSAGQPGFPQGGGQQGGGQHGGGQQGGHQGGGQYGAGNGGSTHQGSGQHGGQGGSNGGYEGRGNYRGQSYRPAPDPAAAEQPEIVVPATPEIKD